MDERSFKHLIEHVVCIVEIMNASMRK